MPEQKAGVLMPGMTTLKEMILIGCVIPSPALKITPFTWNIAR
jgi:hypothetical protein